MNQNSKKPVENEYRSSQMYKTLTGVGIPGADKLAEGLGKAAAGLDAALNSVGPAVRSAAENIREAQQHQPAQGNPNGTYRYNGQNGAKPAGQQSPTPPHQTRYTAQPPSQTHWAQPPRQAQAGQSGWSGRNSQPRQTVRPPQGVTPAPPPQMPPMKLVRAGSPAKFYITGFMALFYALRFPMYEPAHFAVFAIVVALTFLLSSALFRGKKQFVPVEEPKPEKEPEPKPEKQPEPEKEKKSSTGNPEVDKIIDEGHEMIQKLGAANDAIPDEALSADIDRMERASADIFNYIAKRPEKAPQIRKFMNYYLPTTLKLLNSYERLSRQSVKGENITSTLFNIAGMMHTVADAFEKQLDSLFTDEAMDISADITVFETMLKQEGFVEEKKGL